MERAAERRGTGQLDPTAALRAMRECLAGETADDWSGTLALGGDGEHIGRYWIVAPTE
ncbi:MAG: hypothetical protein ACOY4L_03985 [Pseudomonadota bacterium]